MNQSGMERRVYTHREMVAAAGLVLLKQGGQREPTPPPLDDSNKCSLPSISNLLVMADQGSPTSETSPQSRPALAQAPGASFCFSQLRSRPFFRPTGL
ncbi:hypothetical protein B0H65DRAFT_579610 [Neurospora tetraspora]|uniref:Uncharacterized protein n=1 Tax=Neurospora tetraspora TaxID=94610 RepID=A0AAE0J847_9PEZI|nr:hypothetical protein B0H65DRAFT_579610 [Neurospora tetraspora]